MIDVSGAPPAGLSVCKILKLIKNNTYHSLWRIWKAVWLWPNRVHVTSVSQFKSSRAKLLTLSGVTKSPNSLKFGSFCFLFQLLTFLKNICSKSNFSAGVYWFKVKLGKSRFDDIAYACVNSILCSMKLKLISTFDFRQRFCYIVLRTFHYYFIFLLNLVCLELREGFYYFTLIANICFFFLTTYSTLLHFLILHGVASYCYYIAYDSKACSIFDHIWYIVIIEYLSVLHFY